jgi:hypothetical protein
LGKERERRARTESENGRADRKIEKQNEIGVRVERMENEKLS